MKRLLPLFAMALAASGCGENPTQEEKARRAARDVAMVERAQERHAPAQPITPQPISTRDVPWNTPKGMGCAFRLQEAPDDDPILLANAVTAFVKIDGRPLTLAADAGSPELRAGVRRKYTGRTHWFELVKGGEARPVDGGRLEWAGWLSIHDRFDRQVYFAPGKLLCRDF